MRLARGPRSHAKVLHGAILLILAVHSKVKFDLDRSTKKLFFQPFKHFLIYLNQQPR